MTATEPPAKVLVVDDDAALVRALVLNLKARGWEAVAAHDGPAALVAASKSNPDVVLLDLGLPGMSGLDVIAGLRGWSQVPIVVLSARQLSEDKVEALDAGADDYVTKPFGMDELMARLRAAVRRSAPLTDDVGVLRVDELTIDLARRVVTRGGEPVRLTPTEWSFLELLIRHRGKMVGRERILQEVWGPGYRSETNYLRVYAAQLRRKLETDPANPRLIVTIPGAGYLFDG